MSNGVDRSIEIAGLKFDGNVMNGAGPVKLPEHVLDVARSDSAAVVLGSITIDERTGNYGRTYYTNPGRFTLNSKGLPNPGMEYYRLHLPEMAQIAHDHGKPLIVSVAGFSPEEYARLSEVALNCGADGVEENWGCPNVWGLDGKQKRIASFDVDITAEILFRLEHAIGKDECIIAKLSPFSDPSQLESIANVFNKHQIVKAVTSTNTFPNAYYFGEQGEPAIDPGEGLAGMGGEALKPIGLGQIRQLRRVLVERIALIGVGGISTPQDVKDYLNAGAVATQVTTAYINQGSSIFARLQG